MKNDLKSEFKEIVFSDTEDQVDLFFGHGEIRISNKTGSVWFTDSHMEHIAKIATKEYNQKTNLEKLNYALEYSNYIDECLDDVSSETEIERETLSMIKQKIELMYKKIGVG